MLALIILTICISWSSQQLPHGHELKLIVDQGFVLLDKNHDGLLEYEEMATIVKEEDLNHDGFMTLAEYAKYWNTTEAFLAPIFNAYDTDNDGRIPVNYNQQFFHLLDPNDDGVSTLQEYEHYMTGFLQCVYNAHGNHGHGHDCLH